MIASLMMYKRPELVGAHQRYWALIRSFLAVSGIASPQELSQNAEEFSVWQHPQLVLSQTCAMPYRMRLHDKVCLIGTPDFGVTDCPPGYYRSALVVRADDPRRTLPEFHTATFAYNASISQSGFAAPYFHLQDHGFWFQNRLLTGQHLLSARAVQQGQADIAALDAVSWRLMREHEGFAENLRVLEWTKPTPALPYIAAKGAQRAEIFAAVNQAVNALSQPDRLALGIKKLVWIAPETYLTQENPPPEAG